MTDRSVPEPSSVRTRRFWLPAAVLVGAIGAGLGYGIGYLASLGGLGAIGAVFPAMGLGVLVLLAAITGAIGALSGGRRRGLAAPAFATAGLLVLGAVLGATSVPVLGLGYQPPVTLESHGSITLTLANAAGFEPRGDSPARCGSAEGSEAVAGASGLELGELPNGTVRGGFSRDTGSDLVAGVEVLVELFVDGADLPEGARQPFWHGPAAMSELDADHRGGSITFTEIGLQGDAMGNPIPSDGWPESLSGELRWHCGDWEPAAEPQ